MLIYLVNIAKTTICCESQNLGKGLGTQIKQHTKKENPRIIVGHDYRSYSEKIKSALKKGLVSTGCFIEDVGLSYHQWFICTI